MKSESCQGQNYKDWKGWKVRVVTSKMLESESVVEEVFGSYKPYCGALTAPTWQYLSQSFFTSEISEQDFCQPYLFSFLLGQNSKPDESEHSWIFVLL